MDRQCKRMRSRELVLFSLFLSLFYLILPFLFSLFSQANEQEEVKCRYDWHQTAANVVIAIYAKLYHYEKSYVKLNPIRLNVCLVFPQQNDAKFNLDLELRGVSTN